MNQAIRKLKIAIVTILLAATAAYCADPSDVLGRWNTEEKDSILELFECGKKVCGRIVWLKEPNYTDSKEGPVGEPKIDDKNPSPGLRHHTLLGLQVMSDLSQTGDNEWDNGVCYDPESGKTYSCKMKLVSHKKLLLHGYIGFSLLGRDYLLTR